MVWLATSMRINHLESAGRPSSQIVKDIAESLKDASNQVKYGGGCVSWRGPGGCMAVWLPSALVCSGYVQWRGSDAVYGDRRGKSSITRSQDLVIHMRSFLPLVCGRGSWSGGYYETRGLNNKRFPPSGVRMYLIVKGFRV